MGLYDRDYYRHRPSTGVGAVHLWSFTTWLILINSAVFVIDLILRRVYAREIEVFPGYVMMSPHSILQDWGAFSIQKAILQRQAWRLLTFQFLHADIWHILVNMLGLWLFGPVVELTLGSRRYAFFYFLCGMAGPIMYTILWALGIVMPEVHQRGFLPELDTSMIGASAGIFGILMAAAYLAPDRILFLYFFELPLKIFAWIMIAIAAYTVLAGGDNAGGQAAHLGGGLLGFFLIRREHVLNIVARKRVVRGRRVKDWSRDFNR